MKAGSKAILRQMKSKRDIYAALIRCGIVSFLIICVMWARGPFSEAASKPLYRVLVLQSYHRGYEWTDNIMEGIDDTLGDAGMAIEIYVEYLDCNRHDARTVFPSLSALFRSKYSTLRPDMIITCDNDALQFLQNYRQTLFPDVPVVFCGINRFTDTILRGQKKITGVAEDFDVKETLELIQRLQPNIRHIAVVSDNTTTGRINRERFLEAAPHFSETFEFLHLAEQTAEELKDALRHLPVDTAILHLSFYRDREGKTFTLQESNRLIAESAEFPVYSLWDFVINDGVVGGIVTSGWHQGHEAARMAVRILNGEAPERIPVLTESPNIPLFDYIGLQRFSIPVSRLPAGSIIRNRPVGFYEQYGKWIWAALFFVAGQTLVLILLFANITRRRRIERVLQRSNIELENRVTERTADLQGANAQLQTEIDERRRAEDALRDSEKRYRLLFESITDAVMLHRMNPDESGWNPGGFHRSQFRCPGASGLQP